MSSPAAKLSPQPQLNPRPVALVGTVAASLLLVAMPRLATGTDYTWGGPNNGGWSTLSNWSPGTAVPNSNVDRAIFGTGASSDTINIGSANITINQIIGTTFYTLSMSSGSLTFDGVSPLLRHTVSSAGSPLNISGGSLILAADTTFDVVGSSADVNVNLPISGAGGLIKSGSGDLRLEGTQTYQGDTTISGGRLLVGWTFTNAQSGAITQHPGALNPATSIVNNGTLEFGGGSSRTQGTHFGTMSGTGSLVINSGATLNAANTHSGNTVLNIGTLALAHVNALQNSTLDTGTSGSRNVTFTVAGSNTYNLGGLKGADALVIGGNTLSIGANNTSNSYTGAISGTGGGIIKVGTGTQTLASVSNSYTGATSVQQGTLEVTSDNALGTSAEGTDVTSGAALRLNNVAYTTAEALSINGTGVSGGGAMVNSGTSSYAGTITAASHATINAGGGMLTVTGGLVKNGTTLTLTGGGQINITTTGISGNAANSDLVVDGTTVVVSAASNYNGPTTLQNSGTFVANAVITTTAVTVSSNSTLSGTGSIQNGAGLVTMNGALVVGDSTLGSPVVSQFEISGTGSTVLGGSSTLFFDLFLRGGNLSANAAAADRLKLFGSVDATLGGTLVLGNPTALNNFAAGDMWLLADLSGGGSITGAFAIDDSALNLGGLYASFDNNTGILSIAPEPSRALLLMLGLVGVVVRRRRK